MHSILGMLIIITDKFSPDKQITKIIQPNLRQRMHNYTLPLEDDRNVIKNNLKEPSMRISNIELAFFIGPSIPHSCTLDYIICMVCLLAFISLNAMHAAVDSSKKCPIPNKFIEH